MNNSPFSRVRSVIITCVVVLVCVINTPALNAQSLPSPWMTGDVGNPAGQGAATFSNNTFRVNAAAGDIGSQGDQFTFVQRKLTGDGVIVARVRAAQNGDALSTAGVMIRESLDSQSTYVFALATGSGAVRFQRRRTEGGASVDTNGGTGAAPWVKVERRGATFTASRSADGVTWREIGTDIVPMADTVFVGLAVTAGAEPAAATADFSTVSVTETAAPLAAAAPPPGWASADVGFPLLAGSEQENAGVLTVTGGGVDVGGVSDQFHYMYQQVSGDVNIITRVTAVQLVNAASKGGVMIRDSLTSNGAHASMFMTAGNGPAFVRRAAGGGLATSTPTGTMSAPLWMKLELRGDMVTAFQSADGLAWTTVGSVRLSLPTPYYIGWAVSSQNAITLATATFDNMVVSVPNPQNQPPTISLTAPDTSVTYTEPATITISAAAADTDGTISSVDFFEGSTLLGSVSGAPYSFTWSNVPAGSYTFSAVAHDNGGAATTSDVRSVTVSSAANQPPTVSLTSPANAADFTAPASITVSADAADSDGSIARVDFYAGSTLIGTSSTAPYSITWSNVAAGAYSLTAVATDNGGASTTSPARTGSVNARPTVALTAPANGATFDAPASIVISATASDTDGSVTQVTFSAGTTVIGTDTTSPYSVTWSNVPAGTYVLKAVATDNRGATRASATRSITVGSNQPPSVALTNPADGATFTAPATITVDATASDADGTIAKVDFFAGTTLIGSDATSPFSVSWSNVPEGSYSLTAITTDNDGASISSAARTVTVTGVTSTGTAPPAPWTAADIGAPAQAGSAQYANGTYTVDGAGEVGGTADQFQFVYRTASGDVDIRARVGSVEAVQAWSKAGVMVRESLAANAAMGMMFMSASSGSAFHQRLTTGAARTSTTGTAVAPPYWVRLERRGTTLTASQSADGVSWTTIDTMSVSAANVVVGLAVASGDSTQAATAVFNNVTVTTPTNQAPTVSLTAPANGATFTAPATVTVSATASDTGGTITRVDFFAGTTLIGSDTTSPYSVTWNSVGAGTYSLTAVATDNGGATTTSAARTITVSAPNQAPAVSLTAPANGASFTAPASITVSASASDADGTIAKVDFFAGTTLIGSDTASPYSIAWNNVGAGSYSITAVATDNGGATTTSAARTVTVNPPSNQAPTASLTAPANGASFTAPASVTVSASASDADGTLTKVDFFAGTTPIGSDTTSPYSVTWNNVAAGSYSLTAVATDNAGATTTSAARTITVTSTAPPAGWTAADIGAPAQAGSTQYANGTYTVNGAGEVAGTADQLQFVYRTASGDVDIRARVGSVEAVQAWSKAGVMVRESLAANAAMGMMFMSATSGSAFHQRLTTGAARTSTTGTAVAAPYWVRLERRGTTLTASQSVDGVAWTTIGTMSISAANVVVGLAVASGDPAQAATAVFNNVTVTTPGANQAPAVSLTAPANGATFTAPANITMSATASDTDGTVAKVDFFAGSTLIGSDATSPYSITWNSAGAGTYSVTAVATDDDGATRTSAAATITVNGPPNQAPAVSLTAPANGATFTAPASIPVTASASDADGTIAKVEFFAGATLIGSDTTSPYSITWNNVAAGTYSITAVATDNSTAKTTSAARTVTVSAAPPPTSAHAVFTASVDHSMVTRYVLDIFASGADPTTATPIRTQDMGKPPIVNGDCNVDITQTYSALPAGSYISTVSAVGASGSSRSTSTPFTK